MSISIGRIPIYETNDRPFQINTNTSNLIKLRSDTNTTGIHFGESNFFGKIQDATDAFFGVQLNRTNVIRYTSNLLWHPLTTTFVSNVNIITDFQLKDAISTEYIQTSNILIYGDRTIPFRVHNDSGSLLEIRRTGVMYIPGNLGIGITNPHYRLDILKDAYIHSNIWIDEDIYVNNIIIERIEPYTNANLTNILINENQIVLNASNITIQNPSLIGNIVFDSEIKLEQSKIASLQTSNLTINNNQLTKEALKIQTVHPNVFANTALGSPFIIQTDIDNTPVWMVDPFGRIASGKLITANTSPDSAFHYNITSNNSPYISNFMEFITPQSPQHTVITRSGYLGIRCNEVKHGLQIRFNDTGYEEDYQPIESLIGVYTPSISPLLCYDCNQSIIFGIGSNGKLFSRSNEIYGDDYVVEIHAKGFIHTLYTCNIYTNKSYIDGTDESFSNIQTIYSDILYADGGNLSNIYIHKLITDTIDTEGYDYIKKINPMYREFRITSDRLLFSGSNWVMNSNHDFFVNQSLPHDNIRIYANGNVTDTVNVIHTIANNRTSTIRIHNSNVAEDTCAKIDVIANQQKFSMGMLYQSFGTELFVTNNPDLLNKNRHLSITPLGLRVGIGNHLLQSGKVTIDDTQPGIHALNIKGDILISNTSLNPILYVSRQGNIGIGTDIPRGKLDLSIPTIVLTGNLGIGTTKPLYELDVYGTISASNVLGIDRKNLQDIYEEAWTVQPENSNISYLNGNIGIGITHPMSILTVIGDSSKYLLKMSYRNQTIPALYVNTSNMLLPGSLIIGYDYTSQSLNIPNHSVVIEGNVGIGTTLTTTLLHVQNSIHITGYTSNEGNVFIKSNVPLSLGGSNVIIADQSANLFAPAEMVLFKNTNENTFPGRIRLRSGQIDIDAYSGPTTNRSNQNRIVSIKPSYMQVYGTFSTLGSAITTSLSSLNNTKLFTPNIYDQPGNYTLVQPRYYSYVRIQMWGAGGGGAGANAQETPNEIGTSLNGGGGGGSGAYGEVIIPYDIASKSTLVATIGRGGNGGIGGTINTNVIISSTTTSSDVNGREATPGTSGTSTSLTLTTTGASLFTSTWSVGGGNFGTSFTGGAGGTITVTTYFNTTKIGTAGGNGGTSGIGDNGIHLTAGPSTGNGTGLGASGGGGGGGIPASIPSSIAYYSGGNSGGGCIPYTFLLGASAVAIGDQANITTIVQSGQNGYSYTDTYGGGTGGGGGASKNGLVAYGIVNGNSGYMGGWPGGGGGGGGASRTIHPNASSYAVGSKGGNGGMGAHGGMLVTYY